MSRREEGGGTCVAYLDGIEGVAGDNSTHTTYSAGKKVLQSTWLLSTTAAASHLFTHRHSEINSW
jgi:hypothetical protein